MSAQPGQPASDAAAQTHRQTNWLVQPSINSEWEEGKGGRID
jgi:hypothetical protein